MTDFKTASLDSRQLEFLTGQILPHEFFKKALGYEPLKKHTSRELSGMRFGVAEIIKSKLLKPTSSNDPRYDKKEPVMFAVNQIREKGLNRDLRAQILSDKNCIQKGYLSAAYSILNDVLTDTQLAELHEQLAAKLAYHTRKQKDMLGGELPAFINFSNKVFSYNPVKPKADAKSSRKTKTEDINVPISQVLEVNEQGC